MSLCPQCGSAIKTVPAGVSKKTGKQYNSFQACSNRNCSYKPPIDESYTPIDRPFYQPPIDESYIPPYTPAYQPPTPNNITKVCDEKKEMVMSYAKDLVVAEMTTGAISDISPIERVEQYFDRLILKIRSV